MNLHALNGAQGARLRYRSHGLFIVDHECRGPGPLPTSTDRAQCLTLSVVRHGAGEFWLDGRRVLVDPSQIVVSGQGVPFDFTHHGCLGGRCATTIRVDVGLVRALGGRPIGSARGGCSPRVPVVEVSRGSALAIHGLLATSRETPSAPSRPPRAVLGHLRRVLAAGLIGPDAAGAPRVRSCLQISELARRAREELVKKATDGVSLAGIAERIGCSGNHLCRVFKAETGLTTGEYGHRVRIRQALHRLADGEDDLLALALDLGYANHSHFTRVFRRWVGFPPSFLRREMNKVA